MNVSIQKRRDFLLRVLLQKRLSRRYVEKYGQNYMKTTVMRNYLN